jgi:hypothetical protein
MTRAELITEAAAAMLRYEAWLAARTENDGRPYPGLTGARIIARETRGDIHAWAEVAADAIRLAEELRGCSATASRVRGQRAKRSDQRTGRRTIPKTIRRAA